MKQDTIQNVTNVLEDVNIINIINEFLIIVLLIVVVVFVLYCLRDKYVLIYNKIILKMGDFEKSYRKAKDFFESNNLKDAMLIVGDTLKCHNLPPEWKYQFDKLKSDIKIIRAIITNLKAASLRCRTLNGKLQWQWNLPCHQVSEAYLCLMLFLPFVQLLFYRLCRILSKLVSLPSECIHR